MMVSFDEMVRYILMLKEEEMENNYKLTDSQIALNSKVREGLKNNPDLRIKFSKMVQASSLSEMKLIWDGKEKVIVQPESSILLEDTMNLENLKTDILQNDVQESLEKGRQYVLEKGKSIKDDKRAGYVDALVMALVTGFVGGISTAILMMML